MSLSLVNRSQLTRFEIPNRISRYLKEILGKGILFIKRNYFQVEVYCDVDRTRRNMDGRSTPDYYSFVGRNLVTW